MNIYRIFCYNLEKTTILKYLGCFLGYTLEEAKMEAASYYKNMDIVNSSFYDAELVTSESLLEERKEILKELELKTRIINI